jgi:hypothetical protein
MLTVTEIELYQRICELEGISFIECNKDVLDLLKVCYNNIIDFREINRNNVKKVDSNFSLTIENFKSLNHSIKTLESKCDKTLSTFRKEIESINSLKEMIKDSDERMDRITNIVILFYWIAFVNLIITFAKFLFF